MNRLEKSHVNIWSKNVSSWDFIKVMICLFGSLWLIQMIDKALKVLPGFVFLIIIMAFPAIVGLTLHKYTAAMRRKEKAKKSQEKRRIEARIESHIGTLARKRRQLLLVDDYGIQRDAGWSKEKEYFLTTVVGLDVVSAKLIWEPKLEALVARESSRRDSFEVVVESLDPLEFEEHCAQVLRNKGWSARRTQASGDQGVDVIAEKNGIRVVLQCKLYSQPVGNFAVQQAEAGKVFEAASLACVVTNASFTRSARQLATSTGTLLLHHSELSDLETRLNAT